ncbi:MAG: DUF5681 domain-containing protein [Rudaea sp.]|uniref:DUF5681 domain-containing protein n=1 Tax=Rudaea sp. TaxID=2136325 RepID=UPI0039E51E7A
MTETSPRKRGKGAPWRKGESGNPKGRPKGSGLVGELRRAIATNATGIVEALARQALAGDTQAARVLLSKVLPDVKAEALPVHLPELAAGTLTERAQAALQAAGAGEVAPDTAAALVAAVGALARLREVDELESRIAALEERRNENEH